VVGVLALALWLRIDQLTDYLPNPDETMFFQGGVAEAMWNRTIAENAHPPLYYLLLRVLSALGADFSALRWVGALVGVATVGGMYLLGRDRGGVVGGAVAAGLLAVSPAAIEMSQILRPYMLHMGWLTFALLFLSRYLRTRTTLDLVAHSLLLTLALATNYSTAFVIGAELLLLAWLWSRQGTRPSWAQLAYAAAPLLVASLLLYALHLRHLLGSEFAEQTTSSWLGRWLIRRPADVAIHLLGIVRYQFGAHFEWLVWALSLGGAVRAIRQRRPFLWLLPGACVGLTLLAAALQRHPTGCTRPGACSQRWRCSAEACATSPRAWSASPTSGRCPSAWPTDRRPRGSSRPSPPAPWSCSAGRATCPWPRCSS
jgi:4-amino-4-deoxy-L-arabinose transferase-like glycosyltransferase